MMTIAKWVLPSVLALVLAPSYSAFGQYYNLSPYDVYRNIHPHHVYRHLPPPDIYYGPSDFYGVHDPYGLYGNVVQRPDGRSPHRRPYGVFDPHEVTAYRPFDPNEVLPDAVYGSSPLYDAQIPAPVGPRAERMGVRPVPPEVVQRVYRQAYDDGYQDAYEERFRDTISPEIISPGETISPGEMISPGELEAYHTARGTSPGARQASPATAPRIR